MHWTKGEKAFFGFAMSVWRTLAQPQSDMPIFSVKLSSLLSFLQSVHDKVMIPEDLRSQSCTASKITSHRMLALLFKATDS